VDSGQRSAVSSVLGGGVAVGWEDEVVSRGEGAEELRRLLRRELVVRLGPAGWRQLDERAAGPFALAAFVRPVDGEFAATAEVGVAGSVADSPPVEIRGVMLGVSYEPLRRLWPLLDMFGVAVIAEEPEDDDELGLEVGGAVCASTFAGPPRDGTPGSRRMRHPCRCAAAYRHHIPGTSPGTEP
jgi:hypothetical protein